MSAKFWSGVTVAIQSALAGAITITGITKASPGVVTYTGSDPSNGDYVLLSIQGMSQLDARVFRVANVNAGGNTFELEGEDTTLFDTFSSGTFQVITFGTTAATFTGLSSSGGDPNFADTTTIHKKVRTQVPVSTNPITYTFQSIWDPSDTALVALKAASDQIAQRAIRFTFSDGTKVVFVGYISAPNLPTGNAQDKVETTVTVNMYGSPTTYST